MMMMIHLFKQDKVQWRHQIIYLWSPSRPSAAML